MTNETNSNPAAAHQAPLRVFPGMDANAVPAPAESRGTFSFIRQLGIDFVRRTVEWIGMESPTPQTSSRVPVTEVLVEAEAPPSDHASVGDFISTYATWADVVELPRTIHEAVAMQLVASLLNRAGVYIRNGRIWYPMDLWMVLLTESGGGRSTQLGFAADILKSAGISGLLNDCRWGSAPAFLQELSDNLTGHLYLWSEMSEKLALFNSGTFQAYGAKSWLTDRYDNRTTPEEVRYRSTNKSSDTPPITFAVAPRINILAASSENWFYTNLAEDDSAGGWLPRWVFVRVGKRGRSCARPAEPDPAVAATLSSQLQAISKLSGEATMPEEIWQDYELWYEETQRIFESHPSPALAVPYWNRHKGMILKLAVIFEASANHRLVVGWDSWKRAKEKSAELVHDIFDMLDTKMTATGYTLKRYEDHIRDRGSDGLLKSEFTYAFKDDPDREKHLTTLFGGDVIHQFIRPGKGRPGTILVHRDHCSGRCGRCGTVVTV